MATSHQYYTLFLFFTLLFSYSLTTISVSATTKQKQRCHPSDYKVLMQIKKSLNNPYHLASWVPKTDCCEWYCLECDEKTNRVRALTIFSGEISGQIPDAIGDLPYLDNLEFRKLSNITGSIPRSITKLKKLKFVSISWLNLTGPVPDFLSELPNLEFLELNFNQFSGSIPPSFSKFTKLGALHLDRNKLTGSIPESFGHFTGTVPDLYLSHNQLTGTIPKSFGNMDFERIDLSRNKLVGDATLLFKPNGSTQILDISRNMLEFDFSKVMFPKKSLISLDINHNKIYGSIPKDIVKIQHLQMFNASYNRLCGVIPTGGDMARFDYSTYIHNNCLCGLPLKKCT
ncbi:Leucine-rich repeat receptor-like protein kinase pxl1 [Thalictrum thalictroides]|uniref:Leucine-rich repeat receptor-like protein kinase pxl1 n=1 Tax=Thalictrum thalictroides TaxID=46969 RepID=A0A7J6VE21_THATH|nr:Leucine-rich repeat receptor-like protein kinase pxl1 [Thalictrum thalictroides]